MTETNARRQRKIIFRKSDLARALSALKAAGQEVTRLEITPDGDLRFFCGTTSAAQASSPFDDWKAGRHARQA